jgi:hypothetical protein
MKNSACMVALLMTALAAPALAQGDYAQMAEQRFKAADKDGDGKLTRDEARAGMPRVHSNFDKIDTGKLGFVTLAQVKAAMAAAR